MPTVLRTPTSTLLIFAVVFVGACKFAELPPIEGQAVGGTVEGLWTGADLVLKLEPVGLEPQLLTVTGEGTFTFSERLPSDTPFAFSIESDAAQHDCQVETPTGEVGALDVTDLRVRCTSQIAITVALSTLVPFTFDPQTSRQELDVSVLVGQVAVTVGGPVGTTVMLDGSAFPVATPSPAVPLALGQNTLRLDVAVGALSRRYELLFDRGAIQPSEYFYAKASNRDADDYFGFSVAAAGDFVAIGSPFEDSTGENNPNDNSVSDSGAVLVYRRNGSEIMFLKGGMGFTMQNLGFAVAMDDDWFVAGAPNDLGTAPGFAHAWERNGMSWTISQRFTAAADARDGDRFGYAVDVRGDTMAIGAPVGVGGVGAVHVFRRGAIGGWTEEAVLHAPNATNTDFFGQAVSLGDDLVVIGAPSEGSASTGVSTVAATDLGARPSGAVYVFRRTGTAWALEAYIKASNTGMYDNFGMSLDLDGDTLAVGAPVEASGGTNQQDNSVQMAGAVYIFRRSGTSWSQEAYVKAPSPERSDEFGASLSLRGDTLAVGATEFLDRNDPGSVHIFNRVGTTWGPTARITASNADPGDKFFSVALGPDGLYVGAQRESSQASASDNNLSSSGAAYFFR
jgi:hypothetical protein